MSTNPEVQRITQIYQTYRDNASVQAQWAETNAGNVAIFEERTGYLEKILQVTGYIPLDQCRVLDIGCGEGRVLANLLAWKANPSNLYGVDLLADRITTAQQLFPEFNFQKANAERLEFSDASFDLVLLFTVFTSILDEQMAHNAASEVQRVLRPGGAVVWYDFRYNNPRNPHVRGMDEARIHTYFPDFALHLHTITLLPPLARRLGRLTPMLYPLLAAIPFLRTHYLGLLVKPN